MARLIFDNFITEAIHDVAQRVQAGSPFVPAAQFHISIPSAVRPQVPLMGSFVCWELHGAELRLQCKIDGVLFGSEHRAKPARPSGARGSAEARFGLSCCIGTVQALDPAQWPAFLAAVNEAFPLSDSSFSVTLDEESSSAAMAPPAAAPPAPLAVDTTEPVVSAAEAERARREARAAKFGLAASVSAAEKTAERLLAQQAEQAAPAPAAAPSPVDKLSAASPWGQRTEPIAKNRRMMTQPARPAACIFFARGTCTKGSACPFSHDAAATPLKAEKQQQGKFPVRKPPRTPGGGTKAAAGTKVAADAAARGPSPMDTTTGVTSGGKIKKQRKRRAPSATKLSASAPAFVPAAFVPAA